jgi:hypothetical protein
LQPSADELLRVVRNEIAEMERLCGEFAQAVAVHDWKRIAANIVDTRRTLHALENAMGDAISVRTDDFDREIYARMQRIHAFRVERCKGMERVRDDAVERLNTISRWKTYARAVLGPDAGARKNSVLLDNKR